MLPIVTFVRAIRFRHRVAGVGFSAAVAISLTACDAEQVGAAAVVGGERITIAELQDEVRDVVAVANAQPTGDQTDVQLTVLNRMITFRLRDKVAEDANVTVTEAEVDEFIANLVAQSPDGDLTPLLTQNALTEQSLREAVREVLVIEQLGGEEAYTDALANAAEQVGVEVNPRYGTWTPTGLDEVSGSISVPVADLVADQ